LSDEARDKTVAAFAAFTSLRDQLKLDLPSKEIVWDDAQLKLLRAQSEDLIDIAKTTTLADLSLIAKKDVQSQNGRRGGVAALMTRALGQVVTAPGFELYRGTGFDDDAIKGKVTILHFWDYKDSPLSPPYGQVGYLDFLSRKYADKDLQVVGVVVRPELEDPAQRTRVRASTRKFASFMNLSYPVVADVEDYISELGDPRRAGAKLPLFVVLDKSGKVVHYKVGFYEVDREVGLRALHDLVKEQLE
jgi:thiol-disulfide isomerase/thioredoxin